MTLKKYRSKRKLKESGEPPATRVKHKGKDLKFVIQKHAATRLHYDFRIEAGGVLKSWAIPKGPSLNPEEKRLAIQVEDHPYGYRHFEGRIPQGYGAGTVMIWDKGVYSVDGLSAKESEKLIEEGIKKGAIHFTLEGEKLNGEFSLIKLKKEGKEWLLIKKRDEHASQKEILDKERSVFSGKVLEEIGRKEKKPHNLRPMLATLISKPFDDREWIFEIKWDGFRAIAELDGNNVVLYSRNLHSFEDRFSAIAKDLKRLKLDAILDGEIVAVDEKGISHFQLLQNQTSQANTLFYVFDLLYLNGKDLRDIPLIQRKAMLKKVMKKLPHVRFLDHIEKKGISFFQLCAEKGLEGIIGKKKDSLYHVGYRSKEWVKIKAELTEEVVICGFTEPRGSRKNFGALIVGTYKKGLLCYAGHVGGGFSEETLKQIKTSLLPFKTKKCPFKTLPKVNSPVTWLEPHYRCKVKFKEWTNSGSLRQPIFLELSQPLKAKKTEFAATNIDKIYWPEEKITKGDLLNYYDSIAPFLLPFLKDRPESLKRFPEGISGLHFFQKNLVSAPSWIPTLPVEHSDKRVNYLLIQNKESLLYAINLGCIELHPWLSSKKNLNNPDFVLWDLDPEEISFDAVVETAQAIHRLLEDLDVPHFCKTSGARGLHILTPLKAKYSYKQAQQFAHLIATLIHQQLPKITSLERSPKKRQKRVYIDYLQNNFGQTMIAPYSVRAKPGAPVSTPLEWREVKKGLNPSDYHIFNTLSRLKKKGDLFKPLLSKGINMEKVLKKI